MNPVPSQPLPHLPSEDHTLLLRYFSLNEDLTNLAAEPGQPDLLTLLRWLSRPDIAAYTAAYRTHQNQLHRQAVIDALRSVLTNSTDPIELRRAATTLLRALNPVRPPAPPRDPSLRVHPPSTRPAASPTHHHRTSSTLPPVTPSPIHPLTPSSPPPPLTPHTPALSPLSQALAALGLPTDLDELDRLDDEADDAEVDAELDTYGDDQDPPLPADTT